MNDKNDQTNLYQTCSIELAMGCSLPSDVHAWPVGLVRSWNQASDEGAFEGCNTIGEMSLAFLKFRIVTFQKHA